MWEVWGGCGSCVRASRYRTHLELELLLLLRRHRVRFGDDRHDVDEGREAPEELDVDRLQPVRRDEVEAAVDEPVLMAQLLRVARRPAAFHLLLLGVQSLDVLADHIERLLGVEGVAVPGGVEELDLELVLPHRDRERVERRDPHLRGDEQGVRVWRRGAGAAGAACAVGGGVRWRSGGRRSSARAPRRRGTPRPRRGASA